eukprot:Hpha_TRINITY_DN17126_c0_g1::TRINITY_DN17126_c0_g1_i1::g.146652::m.146652
MAARALSPTRHRQSPPRRALSPPGRVGGRRIAPAELWARGPKGDHPRQGRSPATAFVRGRWPLRAAATPPPSLRAWAGETGDALMLVRRSSEDACPDPVLTSRARRNAERRRRLVGSVSVAAALAAGSVVLTVACDPERQLCDAVLALRSRVHEMMATEAEREERIRQLMRVVAAKRPAVSSGDTIARPRSSRPSEGLEVRCSLAAFGVEAAQPSASRTSHPSARVSPAQYRTALRSPTREVPRGLVGNLLSPAGGACRHVGVPHRGPMQSPAWQPPPLQHPPHATVPQSVEVSPPRSILDAADSTEDRLTALERRLELVAVALGSPTRGATRSGSWRSPRRTTRMSPPVHRHPALSSVDGLWRRCVGRSGSSDYVSLCEAP